MSNIIVINKFVINFSQIKSCYLVSIICFAVAIALDFFLVPESEFWRRLEFFSYPLMAVVLIGMMKPFKNFLSIGIFQILVRNMNFN